MMDPQTLTIRPFTSQDSFDELTDLLHRAYAPLAAMGFRYLASHQPVETTKRRVSNGTCLVAEMNGKIVATVTWYRGQEIKDDLPLYRDPKVVYIGQFAVEPNLQRHGIGLRLMRQVEDSAR